MGIIDGFMKGDVLRDLPKALIRSDNPIHRLDGEIFLLSDKIHEQLALIRTKSTLCSDECIDEKNIASLFLSHIACELDKFVTANYVLEEPELEETAEDACEDIATSKDEDEMFEPVFDSSDEEDEDVDEDKEEKQLFVHLFHEVGSNMVNSGIERIEEDGKIMLKVFEVVYKLENVMIKCFAANDKQELNAVLKDFEVQLDTLSEEIEENNE